jgi:hypothetical protein
MNAGIRRNPTLRIPRNDSAYNDEHSRRSGVRITSAPPLAKIQQKLAESHQMSDARVVRFRKRFPERVFADIGACLREGQAVGATILLCCAIDFMARYYSGQPKGRLNKQSYISFMEQYFSMNYDAVQFYQFLRCGLIHGYDMEREYLILGSSAPWARKLHMVYDPKHRATIINPFALYSDVRKTFRAFVKDIE